MQNSMQELFGIMNVLDADKYADEGDFLARFGKGMPTPEQVQDLQVAPPAAAACMPEDSAWKKLSAATPLLSRQTASGRCPESHRLRDSADP